MATKSAQAPARRKRRPPARQEPKLSPSELEVQIGKLRSRFGEEAVEIYDELRSRRDDTVMKTVYGYHHLGTRLNEFIEIYKKEKGERCATYVANLLGYKGSTARVARQFAASFPGDKLQELMSTANAKGEFLNWQHVRMIMRAPTEQRQLVLGQTLEQNLSPKDLARLIQVEFYEGQKRSGGGRKPARPQNLPRAVDALNRMVDKLVSWRQNNWEKEFLQASIRELDPEKLAQPQFRNNLTTTRSKLAGLIAEIRAAEEELDGLLAYVDRATDSGDEDPEVAAPPPAAVAEEPEETDEDEASAGDYEDTPAPAAPKGPSRIAGIRKRVRNR